MSALNADEPELDDDMDIIWAACRLIRQKIRYKGNPAMSRRPYGSRWTADEYKLYEVLVKNGYQGFLDGCHKIPDPKIPEPK
jgi:hypothetical protein